MRTLDAQSRRFRAYTQAISLIIRSSSGTSVRVAIDATLLFEQGSALVGQLARFVAFERHHPGAIAAGRVGILVLGNLPLAIAENGLGVVGGSG
jgi:hypothetical protein